MKKILYAEDNIGMRKMVSHFLDASGFEIIACEDGDEAIEIAKLQYFDLIIMDVTMERVDGITATKLIRNLGNQNSTIPILGLTARTEPQEINQCIDAGMDIVLSKPVDLEALVETILCIEHQERHKPDTIHDNFKPNISVLDIDVLINYRNVAGAEALEGILADFGDLWSTKIAELYGYLLKNYTDSFSHISKELAAIAAGVGAGKVQQLAERASVANSKLERASMIEELIDACREAQRIIDGLQIDNRKEAA